jgi:hypothetical protein
VDGTGIYYFDAGDGIEQLGWIEAVARGAQQLGDGFCCGNGGNITVGVSPISGTIGSGGNYTIVWTRSPTPEPDSVIDEIVDAVKELSQNRTGALLIIETDSPIDDRDFSVPGVKLNAEVSKELLQTIFQPQTLLHDGAVLIRASRIVSAGVILPLSDRSASRQLGTRHRAAMGITERVQACVCVVVSEETGSISLAQMGILNRPLTSSKLKELLEAKLFPSDGERAVAPIPIGNLGRQIGLKGLTLLKRILRR